MSPQHGVLSALSLVYNLRFFLSIEIAAVRYHITCCLNSNVFFSAISLYYTCFMQLSRCSEIPFDLVVGSSGLEPPTSRLSGARSNQLSYEPILVVEMSGFEPLASCLQGRRSPN